jgi:hypothetical protein
MEGGGGGGGEREDPTRFDKPPWSFQILVKGSTLISITVFTYHGYNLLESYLDTLMSELLQLVKVLSAPESDTPEQKIG